MKLGGNAIEQALRDGVWHAYVGDKEISHKDLRIGPNSVDVTLHRRILIPNMPSRGPLDPCRDAGSIQWMECDCAGADGFRLEPGQFVLGAVRERFYCSAPIRVFHDNGSRFYVDAGAHLFAPMYEGRSTCGRIGLASHITAGFGDHAFAGAFTLELVSSFPYPVILREGMRIGQVAFESVYAPKVYEGAYSTAHNDGPVPPVLGAGRF